MQLEDIEIENLDRIERLLVAKHGELSNQLTRHIEFMRSTLASYEIDRTLLDRINDVMYGVSLLDDIKEVEDTVKHLVDTFWHQIGVE